MHHRDSYSSTFTYCRLLIRLAYLIHDIIGGCGLEHTLRYNIVETKPIVRGNHSNCSHEACLVGDKTQNNSLHSRSSTLASLYGGLLCLSMLTYFSEAQIFHTAIENSQLLQYSHAYQLKDCTNVKMMDACTHILLATSERYETEMVASQNNHATEWNINILLTAIRL